MIIMITHIISCTDDLRWVVKLASNLRGKPKGLRTSINLYISWLVFFRPAAGSSEITQHHPLPVMFSSIMTVPSAGVKAGETAGLVEDMVRISRAFELHMAKCFDMIHDTTWRIIPRPSAPNTFWEGV